MPDTEVVPVRDPGQIEALRGLFREYQAAIGIDLCFQGFEDELAGLPGKYAPPLGEAWLLLVDGEAQGCIAVRPFDTTTCEMKRLYVRPNLQGGGHGRLLAEVAVEFGCSAGYEAMVLDTLATMTAARALYRSLGFVETDPYTSNPHDAVFMRRELCAPSSN